MILFHIIMIIFHLNPYAVTKTQLCRIRVQSGNDKGRVFPPLVVIEYAELTAEAVQKNAMIPLHFDISFEMDNNVAHAIEVLCCKPILIFR